MNVRPIVTATLAALFATGVGIAGAQTQSSPTDGRTGGTGPTSATPQTDRSMPSSGTATSPATTDTAGNRASGTNPTDGRNSGTGPMGNNPRTDTVGDARGDMSGRSGSTSERYGSSASSDRVRQVQEALQAKGHDVGGVDGVMGPRTQAALRDYQQSQGMPSTGRLDASTLSGLGIGDAGAGRSGQMNDRNTSPRSSINPMGPTTGGMARPSGG